MGLGWEWGRRIAVFSLLVATAAFAHDDRCERHLAEQGEELARELEDFREASAAPEDRSDEALEQWHRHLVGRMQRLLDRLGVAWAPYTFENGVVGVQLLPGAGHQLNTLVQDLGTKLDVQFFYSPKHMIRGEHVRRAFFNRRYHRIVLSHAIVDGPNDDDSLHHEILHAVFEWFRQRGVDSLFHGRFVPVREGEPMWESDSYANRMSFEELATTSLNLRLLAIRLRAEWRKPEAERDSDKIERILARAGRKARTLAALGTETSAVLADWIPLLAAGKGKTKLRLELDRERLENRSGLPGREVVWARAHRRNVRLKLPFLADRFLTMNRAGLERALEERLRHLHALAARLAVEAEAVRELVAVVQENYEMETLDDTLIDEFFRVASAPRSSTLPWIQWAQ